MAPQRCVRTAWLLLAICAGIGGPAWAAPIWNGSVDATWDNPANWTPNQEPLLTDDTSFPAVVPWTGSTITLTAGEQTNNLTFNNSYTLTGGDLTLGATQSINVGANAVTLACALRDAGAGYIKKSGTGTLILTGDNSAYTRWADVNAGVVSVRNGSSVPGSYFHITNAASVVELEGSITTPSNKTVYLTGTATNDDPTLRSVSGNNVWGGTVTLHGGGGRHNIGVDTGSTLTIGGPVNQTTAGSLWKVGGGTLTLNGACTYTLGTTVLQGTLQIAGADNRLPTATAVTLADVAGATLDLNNLNQTIGSLSGGGGAGGNVTLGSGRLTIGDATSTSFAGVISGSGSLVKQGSGTLTLSGANTYAGGTTVSQGTLQFGAYNSLGSGTVTLGDVGTGANNIALLATFANPSNPITNPIVVSSLAGGEVRLGTTFFNSAVATLFNGTITLNHDVTIQAGNSDRTTFPGRITGTGNITIDSQNTPGRRITFDNNSNDFVGNVTVNPNTILQFNGTTVIPDASDVTVNGTLYFNSTGEAIDALNGSGIVQIHPQVSTSPNFTIGAGGGSGTFSGVIQNGGSGGARVSLTKAGAGTETLSGANTYTGTTTINGGTLQIAGADNRLPTATALTLANAAGARLDLNNLNQTIGSLSGGGTTGGNVTLGSGRLTVGDATSTSYAGVISGTGSLVKQGSGTLTLSGANTFTGGVTVNQGTIKIGNMTALGNRNTSFSTVTVASGGAVDFNGVWDATYGYTIAGTGVGGTGALVNTGAAIGLGFAQCSNIRLSADATIGGTGNWALLTWGYGPTSLDLGGHTLTKTGPNTIYLSNCTVSAGTISIQQGTLSLATNGANASAAALVLADAAGASLNLGNYDLPIGSLSGGGASGGNVVLGSRLLTVGDASSTTYAGVISGLGGRLTKVGAGTLTLTGANTYTGTTAINGGTLQIGGAPDRLPTATALTLANVAGARLDLNNLDQTIGSLSGGGSAGGSVTLGSGGLTVGDGTSTSFAGVISGSGYLVKQGSGTLTLTGDLDYTGGTVVNRGTLRLAQAGLPFPSTGSTGQFGSAHTVTVNSGATLEAGANWVFGDGLADRVVVNGGTLAFVNSDSYLGNIELTGGQITTSGGNRPWRTGNWGSGLITVNPSAAASTIAGSLCFVGSASAPTTTFNVADGAAADDLVVSAIIYDHPGYEGRMRLVKDGPGNMVLSGANTYTGATRVNGGGFLVDGSITSDVTVLGGLLGGSGTIFGDVDVQASGTISAGDSPGHLFLNGSYTQSGTMLAELAGTGQGTSYDWLEVDGLATLGGTIDVNLLGGFVPAPGDYFDILTAADGILNLAAVSFDFSDAQTGMEWWASIVPLLGGEEALRLEAAPEPATLALLALGALTLVRRRSKRLPAP